MTFPLHATAKAGTSIFLALAFIAGLVFMLTRQQAETETSETPPRRVAAETRSLIERMPSDQEAETSATSRATSRQTAGAVPPHNVDLDIHTATEAFREAIATDPDALSPEDLKHVEQLIANLKLQAEEESALDE